MKKLFKKIIAILVLGVAAMLILLFGGRFGFGTGSGFGLVESQTSSDAESEVRENESSANKEITIKVVEDKIYYNGEELSGIEDLRTRITDDDAAGASFIFESEYGIKATMDEVYDLLNELEQSIGIKVTYTTVTD